MKPPLNQVTLVLPKSFGGRRRYSSLREAFDANKVKIELVMIFRLFGRFEKTVDQILS